MKNKNKTTKSTNKTIKKTYPFRNAPQCKEVYEWVQKEKSSEQTYYWMTMAILLERRLTATNKMIDSL